MQNHQIFVCVRNSYIAAIWLYMIILCYSSYTPVNEHRRGKPTSRSFSERETMGSPHVCCMFTPGKVDPSMKVFTAIGTDLNC